MSSQIRFCQNFANNFVQVSCSARFFTLRVFWNLTSSKRVANWHVSFLKFFAKSPHLYFLPPQGQCSKCCLAWEWKMPNFLHCWNRICIPFWHHPSVVASNCKMEAFCNLAPILHFTKSFFWSWSVGGSKLELVGHLEQINKYFTSC